MEISKERVKALKQFFQNNLNVERGDKEFNEDMVEILTEYESLKFWVDPEPKSAEDTNPETNELQSQVTLALGYTPEEVNLWKAVKELCPDKRGEDCLNTRAEKSKHMNIGKCSIRCPRVQSAMEGQSAGR